MGLGMSLCGLLAVLTLVSSCSTAPVAVRPENTARIRIVALVRISEPVYVANDFGNPGLAFGAIGGAVAGASAASTGTRPGDVVKESGFTAGKQLTQSQQERITAAGYHISVVQATRGKPGKLPENYDGVDAADADAILDVAIESFGDATEHPLFSPYWRPSAVVHVGPWSATGLTRSCMPRNSCPATTTR